MINQIFNSAMKWTAKQLVEKYRVYPVSKTALVLIDVQEDFLMPGNKGFQRIEMTAEKLNFMGNLKQLTGFARKKGFVIVYAPYTKKVASRFPAPVHELLEGCLSAAAADGVGNLPPGIAPDKADLIHLERTGLSIFSDGHLHALLQARGIEHLVFAGPLVNLGLDSSCRDSVELGYHATLVKDCVAAMTLAEYSTSVDITTPRFAQTVVSLAEFEKDAG